MKVIDPGEMRDRIEIHRYGVTTGPGGWPEEGFSLHRVVWAKVRYQSGREFREAGMAGATMLATFSLRYRADVTQADRIKFAGQFWDIKGVVPIGFKAGLDINAESIGAAL